MLKRRFIIFIILCIYLFTCVMVDGCQPLMATSVSNITSTTSGTVSSPTKLVQQVVSTTPSIVVFTPTVTPTITPTINFQYKETCLEILQEIPLTTELNGNVVLIGEIDRSASIYNLSDSRLLPFSDQSNSSFDYFMSSPNGKYLAYARMVRDSRVQTNSFLIIEDETHNVIVEKQINYDEWTALYWLDNTRLILGNFFEPIVLNPFTGQSYLITEWYKKSPGGKMIGRLTWDVWGVYDPTLTQVLYLNIDDSIILWDIQDEKILANLTPKFFFMSADTPKWSTDGNQVVFAYPSDDATDFLRQELYSFTREGKLTQLTHLTELFPEVVIGNLRWSPDGGKIAFHFYDSEFHDGRFAIFDFETGIVTSYCDLPGKAGSDTDIIWSPSGDQILLTRLEGDRSAWSTMVVDFNKGYAARLAEGFRPAAWILSEP